MRLRQLQEKDIAGQLEWMHDAFVYVQFKQAFETFTYSDVLNFIETGNNKQNHHFAVVDDFDEYLGTVSLKNIDIDSSSAEFAIVIRRSAWGKGVGGFAVDAILRHAKELGLKVVYLKVLNQNEIATHLYEKFSFIHIPSKDEMIELRGSRLVNRYYKHELE